MVEKELRSLARSPRFRLAFFMGFTFGLLIWLPLFRSTGESWGAGEDLAVAVSFYAMILLAEVAFWNCFGFDRSAIQLYFAAPVGFRQVLVAKNLAALLFVLAEVTAILLALVVVRAPPSLPKVAEVYGAMLVLSVYMLAAGNLSSTYYPHPVSPEHTWGRMSGGKFQALLVFLLPLLGAPIGLAYLARYAWDSVGAFYGVLGLSAAAGAIVYWIAMDSAVAASSHRREALLAALAESGGPFSVE
jgi:ABC-2 type transport system permease protein